MKPWGIFLRVIVLIVGISLIAFNVLLYTFCQKQKAATETISNEQQIEAKVNSNKFKYQQEQIEHLNKDLELAKQQVKDQKDALVQEIEKRQEIENGSKTIETSLVDIKAETDAIKQNMKAWQKDYVSVLAELDKKMDDSQGQIKSIQDNLVALDIPDLKKNINSLKADIEKISLPTDNPVPTPSPADDHTIKRDHLESQ